MSHVFIDSVSIRFHFPKHSIRRIYPHLWGKSTETYDNQTVTSWYMKQNNITLRCFDCFVNGMAVLNVSCSLPKVVNLNNYWYIDDSQLGVFFSRLESVIQQNVMTRRKIDIMKGQVNRADSFYMHKIDPTLRDVYHNAYSCLRYRGYASSRCDNTNYLSSKPFYYIKGNPASVVYRNYDKDVESYMSCYPHSVHEDFEDSQLFENIDGYRRFEAQYLRPKLKGVFKKKSIVLADILNPSFQVQALDTYFQGVKLYDVILPLTAFNQQVRGIFSRLQTQSNAVRLAHHIRNHRTPKLSDGARRYITTGLHKAGIHYVTTPDRHNGLPVPPLTPINKLDLYYGAGLLPPGILNQAATVALQVVTSHMQSVASKGSAQAGAGVLNDGSYQRT